MKKTTSLLFRVLPNAAHFAFCVQVSELLADADAAVLTALGDLPARFNAWLDKAWALMNWVRKSVLTEQIAAADRRIRRALVSLSTHVRVREYSHTPTVVDAARRLRLMLKNYGVVYSKPYDEEEGDMRAIIDLLLGTYAADVALLELDACVAELQAALTEFQTHLGQRNAHSLDKPAETFKMVRRGLEAEYHKIVKKLDAGATLNVDPGFAACVDRLNPDIQHQNLTFHRVRKDIGAAGHGMVEPIDVQPYTGKAVTPIPQVYCREEGKDDVALAFAKDFSVTYRYNVNVGMAYLTVHGKGAYRGRMTVSFNIAESE